MKEDNHIPKGFRDKIEKKLNITHQGTQAKYFVRKDGSYIGAFAGVLHPDIDNPDAMQLTWPEIPVDGIEVPYAPSHALDIWDFEEQEYIPQAPNQ